MSLLPVVPEPLPPPLAPPRAGRDAVPAALDLVERTLRTLLEDALTPLPGPRPPGRPPVLPAMLLWTGLLVGILRGFTAQRDLWRLLALHGLWDRERLPVSDRALYQRLARTPPTALQALFAQVTTALQAHFPAPMTGATVAGRPLAPFARELVALDHTILAPVARKLKLLRGLPPTDDRLLPGALGCRFDLRRQQWQQVQFTARTAGDLAHTGEVTGNRLIEGLPPGSLILADLGFFSFPWFDSLTDAGYYYVSRLKEKVTYLPQHTFYHVTRAGVTIRDQLIYLGQYRADRAGHPVRLVEITVGERTYRYLTNVLDPRVLPAWEVAELYRRRWNIEQAFDLIKTHLGLHLLWSASASVVQQQVFATLIIAQIVLALRTEVATAAAAEIREVSLPLLVRWLPRLAQMGQDPLAAFVATGRQAGYIRPFRGHTQAVPEVPLADHTFPERPIPWREPRYGSRAYEQRCQAQTGQTRRQRRNATPKAPKPGV